MRELSPAEITRDLRATVNLFERHSVDYLIIGALALSVWGRPRTTLDLDFLVLVDPSGLGQIRRLALRHQFKVDQKWLRCNPLLTGSQVRLGVGRVPVDVMVPRDDHDRQSFKRKRRKKLGGQFYNFVSPEDLLLQKLKVGRPRDFEDAVTVLERMRGKLKMNYLRRWARRLGIVGELNYILTV